jgi:hypothetical protein
MTPTIATTPKRATRLLGINITAPIISALNADQAAPGPTDDGQWGTTTICETLGKPMARLPRRRVEHGRGHGLSNGFA